MATAPRDDDRAPDDDGDRDRSDAAPTPVGIAHPTVVPAPRRDETEQ